MRFGWLELAIVLVFVFIIFGVGKLPRVSEALGRGLRNLRGNDKDEHKSDSGSIKVIRKLEDEKTTSQASRYRRFFAATNLED